MEKERLKKILQEVREYYGLSYQEFASLVEVAYFNMRDRKEKILIHWKLPNGAYLDKIIISRCCPYRSRKYMISLFEDGCNLPVHTYYWKIWKGQYLPFFRYHAIAKIL